jgi:hypothetical protein
MILAMNGEPERGKSMATRAIENWTKVFGIVETIHTATDLEDFVEVQIEVEQVETVNGYANLFENAVGSEICVHVAAQQATALNIQPGDVIACQVRRVSATRAFAHRQYIEVYHPNAAPQPESAPPESLDSAF